MGNDTGRFSAADMLARMAADALDDKGSGEGRGPIADDGEPDAVLESMMPKDRLFMDISVDEIHPSRSGQTRQTFDADKLAALAESIRRHGVKEPIIVRRSTTAAGYELVAGERRWRAAKSIGLATIPALVERKLAGDDDETLLIQVNENVHREDFNPIEEAAALAAIMARKKWTVEQASEEMGKSRTQGYRLLQLHNAPLALKTKLLHKHVEFRAACEFVRIYNIFAKDDEKRAMSRVERLMAKVEQEQWPVSRLAKHAKALGDMAGEQRMKKKAAKGDQLSDPPTGERGADLGHPTSETGPDSPVTANSANEGEDNSEEPPVFTQESDRLTIDLGRIRSGDMAPEARAELITLLDDLLTRLRRR